MCVCKLNRYLSDSVLPSMSISPAPRVLCVPMTTHWGGGGGGVELLSIAYSVKELELGLGLGLAPSACVYRVMSGHE